MSGVGLDEAGFGRVCAGFGGVVEVDGAVGGAAEDLEMGGGGSEGRLWEEEETQQRNLSSLGVGNTRIGLLASCTLRHGWDHHSP